MRDEKRFKLQKAYTPSGSSLVAQMVKHLPTVPTMWETRVQSLGRKDLLEKEMATHSSILAWKISWMVETTGPGVAKSQTQLSNFTIHPAKTFMSSPLSCYETLKDIWETETSKFGFLDYCSGSN